MVESVPCNSLQIISFSVHLYTVVPPLPPPPFVCVCVCSYWFGIKLLVIIAFHPSFLFCVFLFLSVSNLPVFYSSLDILVVSQSLPSYSLFSFVHFSSHSSLPPHHHRHHFLFPYPLLLSSTSPLYLLFNLCPRLLTLLSSFHLSTSSSLILSSNCFRPSPPLQYPPWCCFHSPGCLLL